MDLYRQKANQVVCELMVRNWAVCDDLNAFDAWKQTAWVVGMSVAAVPMGSTTGYEQANHLKGQGKDKFARGEAGRCAVSCWAIRVL